MKIWKNNIEKKSPALDAISSLILYVVKFLGAPELRYGESLIPYSMVLLKIWFISSVLSWISNFCAYLRIYWFLCLERVILLHSDARSSVIQVKHKTLIIWGEDDQIIDYKLGVVRFFLTSEKYY